MKIAPKLKELREKKGKIYAPIKYFRGLRTLKAVEERYNKMLKKDYKPFKTNTLMKTKTSQYTLAFRKKYPNAVTLPQISKATQIPLSNLREVYKKGLAAWRTGHRPGASPQAWAYARVHSYAMKGKTYYTADRYLHERRLKK
ncbi:hypothetical protein [Dishui Lake phycodnavirus 4]|jgi:hypothetical protein|nr:hypothetical protein [Dishui Lake phycodnavirus 4]